MADSWNSFYKSCPDSLIPLKLGPETFDWLLRIFWGPEVVDWSSQSFPWIWLLPDYRNDSCVECWKIAASIQCSAKKKVVCNSVKFLQITQIIFLETLRRSFKKMIGEADSKTIHTVKLMLENWWHDWRLQNISCKKMQLFCSQIWSLRISLLLLLLQGFVEEYKKELGRELQRGIKHFCDS